MKLKEAILQLIGQSIKTNVFVGKVVSFESSDWTVEIEIENKVAIDGVRVRSVIDSVEGGILVEPKVGSYVLVCLIDNRIESLFIIGYSEIVKHVLIADEIQFNGDSNGGLVKSEVVSNEIQGLKDDINALKTALSAWIPAPGDGGAALKVAITTYAAEQLLPTIQSDYENNTVKHGE